MGKAHPRWRRCWARQLSIITKPLGQPSEKELSQWARLEAFSTESRWLWWPCGGVTPPWQDVWRVLPTYGWEAKERERKLGLLCHLKGHPSDLKPSTRPHLQRAPPSQSSMPVPTHWVVWEHQDLSRAVRDREEREGVREH